MREEARCNVKKTILTFFFLTICFVAQGIGPKASINQGSPNHQELRDRIHATLVAHLPKKHLALSPAIASAIIHQSLKAKLDPLMITAVIAGESGFNPSAVGSQGELGLMQIRPLTGRWIANKASIEWKGSLALKQPLYNIRLGIAYLSYLKKKFSPFGGQIYLAAYNMGEVNVMRFINKKITPKIYSQNVLKKYRAINDLARL
jgi:soluble lytic murein transglycosylase